MIAKAFSVLCACSALAMSASAVKAASGAPAYTIEDVRSCSRDAMRLCRDKLPDLNDIEECMKAHYEQLSPSCQARFGGR